MLRGARAIGGRCSVAGARLVCLVMSMPRCWRRFPPRYSGRFGCSRGGDTARNPDETASPEGSAPGARRQEVTVAAAGRPLCSAAAGGGGVAGFPRVEARDRYRRFLEAGARTREAAFWSVAAAAAVEGGDSGGMLWSVLWRAYCGAVSRAFCVANVSSDFVKLDCFNPCGQPCFFFFRDNSSTVCLRRPCPPHPHPAVVWSKSSGDQADFSFCKSLRG